MYRELKKLLPPRKFIKRNILESYGGLFLLSVYVGFNKTLFYWKLPTFWSHGWRLDDCIIHPFSVLTDIFVHGGNNKNNIYLVARKSEQNYLIENGYINSKAIGLPIVYLPEKKIERVPNSLLVMPSHSDNTIHTNWKFQEYVDQICGLKNQFDHIVICIHPLCIRDGYWYNEFKAAGFEIVEGAIGNDANALLRIQLLMQSFEYITTCGFGSHLVYGAFFGAKMSIFGSYAVYTMSDYENDSFYSKYRFIAENDCQLFSENSIKEKFPFLFCHPKEAIQNIEWGKYEVGYENKLSKEEVLALFGWNNFYWSPKGWKYWLSENTPESFKKVVRIIMNIFR